MAWGVHPVRIEDVAGVTQMVDNAVECARKEGLAEHPDHIVITAGMPFGTPGATNLLRIVRVPEQEETRQQLSS